ncbi:disease resistance protein TAO1-like [Nymphaea colorata]|nr:disease resistance protein TAO1-like [Nymphaea colorata]
MPINDKDDGITKIRNRIGDMKVLVVLDDVDHKDQLDALVGSQSGWFSSESITIVTCRDESIFKGRQKVIYMVPELDPAQLLKRFSQHAFKQPEPKSDWRGELSKKVVSIAGGIPLCLQVFGSLFSDIKSIEGWESKLEQLKRDQNEEVHVRLKISYDSLDTKKQQIFLDIACFLIGWEDWMQVYPGELERWEERKQKKEYAMLMWEGSRLYPTDAIEELQRKFLISINDEHGTFEMHDQIRDMGRNIVQQEPVATRGELLADIQPIESAYSQELQEPQELPDFRLIPNATKFVFEGCTKLGRVHESIGDLQRLVRLNLGDCRSLKKIPDSICRLSSLEKLVLSGCWSLGELPEEIGRLTSLKVLQLGPGDMQRLPESVGLLTNLQELEAILCTDLKTIPDISNLQALRRLRLSGCSQLMDVTGLSKLRCLESLQLNGCNALRDMNDMMKEAKFEHCKYLSIPGQQIDYSRSKSTGGWAWLVTESFALPNVPRPGRTGVVVEGLVPRSYTVTQVKAERHDSSTIIFEEAESDEAQTEPER